jgi:DNA-binding MurR/RpiR family transcriptional regulator
VAVTSQPTSPVAQAADLLIPVAPGETPYASSVNSKIAHLFIVDLLTESVAEVLAADRPAGEEAS